MMTRNLTRALLMGACALGAARATLAAPIATRDAADFNYRWDFDGATTAGCPSMRAKAHRSRP